jgi:mycofactocin biosynthesis protein MftB
MTLDPARPYRLHPGVALRPEPFGALAYHYGNRRLTFLKSPDLVELVRDLHNHESVAHALARLPAEQRELYTQSLATLEASDVIAAR